MSRLALYRAFRPQTFAEVVGQEHVTRTLQNALRQQRLHHAYLFSGPRGTGKTTLARILAKAVNCLNLQEVEPCNQCAACQQINQGQTMDVIEIDAASNRNIDDIRDLRDKIKYAPADLKKKVYIIDEVHMLTEPAFNALLKTLEEPPEHALFVLATTDPQKVPITIASRCQRFEMHRLSLAQVQGHLAEVCQQCGFQAEAEALVGIARQSDGCMRDALSLLDQAMAFASDNVLTASDVRLLLGVAPTEQFLALDRAVAEGDPPTALLILDELLRQGKDLRQFVRDYLTHWRDLLLFKVAPNGSALWASETEREALRAMSERFSQEQMLHHIALLSPLEMDMRQSIAPRLMVEVALIRMCGSDGSGAPSAAVAPSVPVPFMAPSRPAPKPEPAHPVASAPATETVRESARPLSGSTASPAALTGERNVADAWPELLAEVRRARPSTASILGHFRPQMAENGHLVLRGQNPAFVKLLSRPDDVRAVREALRKVMPQVQDVRIENG